MAEIHKIARRPQGWFNWTKPLTAPGRLIHNLSRNPIILKELRGRMRSWRALLNLSIYVSLLSIFAALAYAVLVPLNRIGSSSSYYYSSYSSSSYERVGNNLFSSVIVVQILIIAAMVPSFTSSSLAGEKERQTYEILLLTLLQPHQIVLGKLFSTLAYFFLFIMAALPVESIVFLVGGVGLDQLFIGLVVPLLTTLMLGALGLMWSGILRTTNRASRSTYLCSLVLLLGVPALAVPFGYFIFGKQNVTSLNHFMMLWSSAFNPVVAVASSNELLGGNTSDIVHSNILYFTVTNGDVYPMPWIIFLGVALSLTSIFIAFAVRSIKPLKLDGFRVR